MGKKFPLVRKDSVDRIGFYFFNVGEELLTEEESFDIPFPLFITVGHFLSASCHGPGSVVGQFNPSSRYGTMELVFILFLSFDIEIIYFLLQKERSKENN